jgi:hypothetical protein
MPVGNAKLKNILIVAKLPDPPGRTNTFGTNPSGFQLKINGFIPALRTQPLPTKKKKALGASPP